jgi:ABC-type nitrate/sulfonate/bicarbonate transport system substrate-binding protein
MPHIRLFLAILIGLTTSALADRPLRVGIAQPEFSLIPLDVGIATGRFAAAHLVIDKLTFAGAAKVHQAIAADAIDIALSGGPQMAFIVKGAPERAVAALANAPADLALVALADGPIRAVSDLKGRRISISTGGSLTEWAGHVLARQQGWGPGDLTLVPLGSFLAQSAALKTGNVDAMLTESGTAGRLAEQGVGRTLMNFGGAVEDFHIHVIFARTDFMRDHPDDLRRFLAALLDSIRFMRADKPRTVEIASNTLKISPSLAARLYDELMPYYTTDGRFHPRALAAIADAMVDMGSLKQPPDMAELTTEEYLPKD